jgi:hypothetical protein
MTTLLVAGGVIGIIGIAIAGWFSASAVAKRRIKQALRVPIVEAREGEMTKIVGRLELAGPPLIAPLTQRKCAYFHAYVEEKHRNHWSTVVSERDACEFFVVDETGRARIDVLLLQGVVVSDAHTRSGISNDAPAELEDFLHKHGESSQGLLFNRTLRYVEGILEAGETVAVIGRARWEMSQDPSAGGFRGGAKQLVLEGVDLDHKLIVSDDPELVRA